MTSTRLKGLEQKIIIEQSLAEHKSVVSSNGDIRNENPDVNFTIQNAVQSLLNEN